MKIVIPIAGLGTRFQKVADLNPEYKKPKPFIDIKGLPMVRWATGSLPFFKHKEKINQSEIEVQPRDIVFVILREHEDKHNIEKILKDIYSNEINVVVLDKATRGAAETVYKVKDFIDPEDSLIISDSDHFFDGIHLQKAIIKKNSDTAGIIPVFRARNEGIPKWSYSLLKVNSNYIEKVAEKDRALMEAGAYANIGAYYFSKGKYFFDAAEEVIRNNKTFGDPDKSEFYVAPLFQVLIERGEKIEAAIIPEVWGLGTPEDLEYFIKKYDKNQPHY